jgi:uncharacterized membrane protein YeiH
MTLIYIFTLIGTFFFAISGVLAGIKKRLDLFGLFFISFATSLGGGTIRDLLIGSYPIGWVSDINYPLAVLLAVIITIIFQRQILKIKRILLISDMIGVAIFSIMGLQKSIESGISPGSAVIFGVISAIMGGVIRDILCNEIPVVLRREIYASACIIGGIVFVILSKVGFSSILCFLVSSGSIITIRIISIKYRLFLPRVNYTLKKEIR